MRQILGLLILLNCHAIAHSQVIVESREQVRLTISNSLSAFNMDKFFNKKISKDSTDHLKAAINDELIKQISKAVDPILTKERNVQNHLAKMSGYQDPMQRGIETIFIITAPSLLRNDCDDTKRKILEIFNANWQLVLNYNNDLQKYLKENTFEDERLLFINELSSNLDKEILYVKSIVNIHETTIVNWNSNPEITSFLKKISDNQKYLDKINTISFQLSKEISKNRIIRLN